MKLRTCTALATLIIIFASCISSGNETKTDAVCASSVSEYCILKPGHLNQAFTAPTGFQSKRLGVDISNETQYRQWLDRSFKQRLSKTLNTLRSKTNVMREIDRASALYRVPAAAIITVIALENTLNYGIIDEAQDKSALVRTYIPFELIEWTPEEKQNCKEKTDGSEFEPYRCLWSKVESSMSYNQMKWKFGTIGLGQVNPFRAMMVNHFVSRVSGYKPFSDDMREIYSAILDEGRSVHYVAATLAVGITTYRDYAKFDVSQNIGILASLYNLGNEKNRALKLAESNRADFVIPKTNFFGFLADDIQDDVKGVAH